MEQALRDFLTVEVPCPEKRDEVVHIMLRSLDCLDIPEEEYAVIIERFGELLNDQEVIDLDKVLVCFKAYVQIAYGILVYTGACFNSPMKKLDRSQISPEMQERLDRLPSIMEISEPFYSRATN